MPTYSSALACKTSWTEERGRLQSMGSQRVEHYWVTSLHFIHMYICVCVCIYMYFVFCFHWLFLCRTLMYQFSLQFWAIVKDKEAWRAAVRGVTKVVQDLPTEQQCASIWQMFRLCWMIKSIIEKFKGKNKCWGSHGKRLVAQANQWYWWPSKHSREIPSLAAAAA